VDGGDSSAAPDSGDIGGNSGEFKSSANDTINNSNSAMLIANEQSDTA